MSHYRLSEKLLKAGFSFKPKEKREYIGMFDLSKEGEVSFRPSTFEAYRHMTVAEKPISFWRGKWGVRDNVSEVPVYSNILREPPENNLFAQYAKAYEREKAEAREKAKKLDKAYLEAYEREKAEAREKAKKLDKAYLEAKKLDNPET